MLDLPGTYSLRARSPDEVVTRDAVLGRLAGEVPPDVVVCVADATNLRLVLRLALELKQVGRPMVLAMNMYDIAQRQGLRIDLEGLSREIGAPIVTTVATRKRGIDDLVSKVDALAAAGELAGENTWREPVIFTVSMNGSPLASVQVVDGHNIGTVSTLEQFWIYSIINGITTQTAATNDPDATVTAVQDTFDDGFELQVS